MIISFPYNRFQTPGTDRKLVRVGLIADVFDRAHTAEDVEHGAGRIADISKLVPVVSRDDEQLPGLEFLPTA